VTGTLEPLKNAGVDRHRQVGTARLSLGKITCLDVLPMRAAPWCG
jgi:hypothetical protein